MLSKAAMATAAAVFCLAAAGPARAAEVCDYARAPYTIQRLPFVGLGTFSPDGQRAIVSQGADELRVFDLEAWRFVETFPLPPGTRPLVPDWTAAGKILFSARRQFSDPVQANVYGPSVPLPLYSLDEDGTGLRPLPYPAEVPAAPPGRWWSVPRVSPDGRTVMMSRIEVGRWDIWRLDVRYDADGTPSLENPRIALSLPQYGEVKDFTEDGRKAVIASSRGEGSGDKSLNSDVFLLDLATGELERLTHAPTWDEDADVFEGAVTFISDRDTPNPEQFYYWVPAPNDADSVAVAAALLPLNTWTSHELFVAGPDGDRGWVRRLTFDYQTSGWVSRSPLWSPDGRRIAFLQQADQGRAGWNTFDPTAWRAMLLTFDCSSTEGGAAPAPEPTRCEADGSLPVRLYALLHDAAKDLQYVFRGQTGQSLPTDLAGEVAAAAQCSSGR